MSIIKIIIVMIIINDNNCILFQKDYLYKTCDS